MVLEGVSANFLNALQQLVDQLDGVLARPLKIPVHAPKQAQRRLLPSEVAQLVADYRAGEDMKVSAERYSVHRTTVASWLHENNCQLRRLGISEVALPDVIRLYLVGSSCQRLAERFDCDPETVRQQLKRAGVVMRKPWERP